MSLTVEERTRSTTYVQPEVKIGQTVYWFPDGKRSNKPAVAFVTDVGLRTVDVALLQHGIPQLFCKEGVRHIDDPKAKESEIKASGCWDYVVPRKPKPLEVPAT